jgi:hypothetical protein
MNPAMSASARSLIDGSLRAGINLTRRISSRALSRNRKANDRINDELAGTGRLSEIE